MRSMRASCWAVFRSNPVDGRGRPSLHRNGETGVLARPLGTGLCSPNTPGHFSRLRRRTILERSANTSHGGASLEFNVF